MSEIEKLYRNANINKSCQKFCVNDFSMCNRHPEDCDNYTYPPFTAEKQLAVIKFLLQKGIYDDTIGDEYWFSYVPEETKNRKYRPFDEAISKCINDMWEIITPKEKQLIKEILK